MELLKKGYYLSASLFVITCFIFFAQQMLYGVNLFHPDTRAIAVFELSCIGYNLVYVAIESFVVGYLCGCPFDRKSIHFVAVFAICAFLFAVWLGVFVASTISNPNVFFKISIFCLISAVQTVLLPTVLYFGEQSHPQAVGVASGRAGQKRVSRLELARI